MAKVSAGRTRLFLVPLLITIAVLTLVPAIPILAAEIAPLRTWWDNTGKHKVQARFISNDGVIVELAKPNGDVVKLPFTKLSKKDQQYAQLAEKGQWTEAAKLDVVPEAVPLPSIVLDLDKPIIKQKIDLPADVDPKTLQLKLTNIENFDIRINGNPKRLSNATQKYLPKNKTQPIGKDVTILLETMKDLKVKIRLAKLSDGFYVVTKATYRLNSNKGGGESRDLPLTREKISRSVESVKDSLVKTKNELDFYQEQYPVIVRDMKKLQARLVGDSQRDAPIFNQLNLLQGGLKKATTRIRASKSSIPRYERIQKELKEVLMPVVEQLHKQAIIHYAILNATPGSESVIATSQQTQYKPDFSPDTSESPE